MTRPTHGTVGLWHLQYRVRRGSSEQAAPLLDSYSMDHVITQGKVPGSSRRKAAEPKHKLVTWPSTLACTAREKDDEQSDSAPREIADVGLLKARLSRCRSVRSHRQGQGRRAQRLVPGQSIGQVPRGPRRGSSHASVSKTAIDTRLDDSAFG